MRAMEINVDLPFNGWGRAKGGDSTVFYEISIQTLAASLDNHKRLTTHGPSPRNRCSQSARRFSPGDVLA